MNSQIDNRRKIYSHLERYQKKYPAQLQTTNMFTNVEDTNYKKKRVKSNINLKTNDLP